MNITKSDVLGISLFLVLGSCVFQAKADIALGFGGVSSDILNGNGGSKSVMALSVSDCSSLCYSGLAWRVIEQMDDDIGIVPESGWSVSVTTSGPWFLGARFDGLPNVLLGTRFDNFEAALIVPSSNGRFGFTSQIKTEGQTYGFMRYEYTGTQDPDTKDSLILVGVGYRF